MKRLDALMQYLEEQVDFQRIAIVKTQLKKALNYRKTNRLAVRILSQPDNWNCFPYQEAVNDLEKMLFNELIGSTKGSVYNSLTLKDDSLPVIRANYGAGILPSLFGLTSGFGPDGRLRAKPLESLEAIRRIIDRGVPSLRAGLGAKVFATHEYFRERLSQYPKCNGVIKIAHPDLRGPLDIAHLIWGDDLYRAFYEEPQVVAELLTLITETFIRFLKAVKASINDEEDSFIHHWGTLYKGSVLLTNDFAANLPREIYQEFAQPYDEMILTAFGNGSIHYCGRADQWIFQMLETEGLAGLNIGQPAQTLFGFDFLNMIYRKAEKNKIAIIDYHIKPELLKTQLFQGLLKSDFQTGVTFTSGYRGMVNNLAAAKKLLRIIEEESIDPELQPNIIG